MDGINQSPEHLPSAERAPSRPDQAREGTDIIGTLEHRASRLERLKESQNQATGQHDDEDQQSALQAAKSARKGGRFVRILDNDVDLNVVTGHFFTAQARKVSALIKRDIQKAVEWLAGLREAYQAYEQGPHDGKRMQVVVLAIVMFWKV